MSDVKLTLPELVYTLVKREGDAIVTTPRLCELLAGEMGETFEGRPDFEKAVECGVGAQLLELKKSCRGRMTESAIGQLDSIKQQFAVRSHLERAYSDHVVECIAYGLGLRPKVDDPSVEGTTAELTQKLTQAYQAVERVSRDRSRNKKILVVGVVALVICAVLVAVMVNILLLDNGRIPKSPERKNMRLVEACAAGDAAYVGELLRNGAYVKAQDSLGNTPLQKAIRLGHAPLVDTLLKHGAATEDEYDSLLAFARRESSSDTLVKYFTRLRDARNHMRVNLQFASAIRGGRLDSARVLLKQGADIDYVNPETHYAAIHYAVYNNNVDALKFLAKQGANMDLEVQRSSPAEMALNLNRQKAFNYLKTVVPNLVNKRLPSGETLLNLAVHKNKVAWVKLLLKSGAHVNDANVSGTMPIHEAARYSDSAMVKLLYQHGADIKAKDFNDDEPIDIADDMDNDGVKRYLSQFYTFGRIKLWFGSVIDWFADLF